MKRSPGSLMSCAALLLTVMSFTVGAETVEMERIPAAPGLESSRASIPYQNELERSAMLPDLTQDPHVIQMLTELWRLTHNGSMCHERGAWIIRGEDGSHSCQQVPPTYECNQLTFNPRPPAGAIAFVHTHPAPRGVSRNDEGADPKVAKILGLPLYTVEIDGISKHDPATGRKTREVMGRSWLSKAPKSGLLCPIGNDPGAQIVKKKPARPDESASVAAAGN